jgi:ABC-2 type transport system permease protein
MLPTDLSIPPLPLDVLVHYLILFVLGFFVFAGYYAAIGSAFNSTQEAQQLAVFAILFLIAPIFLFQIAINDPDSTLITGMSFIPVFTPLMMALRIAIKMPPLWQLLLSYVITGGFVVFMVWVCSRIYRIGILMYGKRPTVAEIIRWARVG